MSDTMSATMSKTTSSETNEKQKESNEDIEEINPSVSKEEDAEAEAEADVEEEVEEAEVEVEAEESDTEGDTEAEEEEEDVEEEEDEDEEGEEGEEGETVKKVSKPVIQASASKTKRKNIGLDELKTKNASMAVDPSMLSDSDEEDEAHPEDENYLQKFDRELRANYILNFHPESKTHNYEEVKALSRVSRDGRGIIIDPLHKTIPFLSKYELTRVLGQRAKQLDTGARSFVQVPLDVIDGYHIALLELKEKKMPFIIKRPLPNGGIEYWNVSDLELL
jgi:DNA-directed RNA polymerase subunit K/omega